MPFIIYIFALCAFAIGFTEFVTIGLVPAIAQDLAVSIPTVGLAVTIYALGVVIGAPFLTALASHWPRKRLLIFAMLMFVLANAVAGFSSQLIILLSARLISGFAHGIFIAVAASAATQLVKKQQEGLAISLVFGGATVAMAFGVPVGTWLGNLFHWQWVFFMLSLCGFFAVLGLTYFMPFQPANVTTLSLSQHLGVIFNPQLLLTTLIPLISYLGIFTFYTYISPTLLQLTHLTPFFNSLLLLSFGIGAAIGNYLGGVLTDKLGYVKTATLMLTGIVVVLMMIQTNLPHALTMSICVTLLGLATFGAISPLQTRIIALAKHQLPYAVDIASGLNIAAFNAGVVGGSLLGGMIIQYAGLTYLSGIGAIFALLALGLFIFQSRSKQMTFID
ncbi:MFS transporter [Acinetobacter qingfengensis]|uniref:MFS transporter n=1 Tax=Acinetobacter qingfengensis TaxID=1262585 RepID=A0A1E7RCW1_9GAMM|nr:MFS transporter [Acinetobacter qingfengensis]KAA8734329.1 MFS transporter [Acinetobacter qingfengensis]OEY97092.1 MFS transporter [Acinetobacter qingfengensis]